MLHAFDWIVKSEIFFTWYFFLSLKLITALFYHFCNKKKESWINNFFDVLFNDNILKCTQQSIIKKISLQGGEKKQQNNVKIISLRTIQSCWLIQIDAQRNRYKRRKLYRKWKRDFFFTLPFGALTLISIQYLSINPRKFISLCAAYCCCCYWACQTGNPQVKSSFNEWDMLGFKDLHFFIFSTFPTSSSSLD